MGFGVYFIQHRWATAEIKIALKSIITLITSVQRFCKIVEYSEVCATIMFIYVQRILIMSNKIKATEYYFQQQVLRSYHNLW